nr:MAG TPA: hypothetical protein [Caudoviricetes sp.]
MAYQDELRNYFNELTTVFKGPLSISDQQKIFSPLDIVNASFIITRKYNDSVEIRRDYIFYDNSTTYLITYTDPTSYIFCSGTGDKYRFLSLPFDPYGSDGYLPDRTDAGGIEIGVNQIVSGDSTKLLCLDEKFNIVKDDNDNDCVVSVTNWDAENLSGKYIIPYPFDYLIFVKVRDKSQEVTNNG